ncbi:MAG: MaoC family dehydratase, partial [Desulfuromonadaceae bacterium]
MMEPRWRVGQRSCLTKKFSAPEIETFAAISLDRNPLHLDAEYAKNTPFGGRIVHGMLVAGLISALIGQELPGEGSILLRFSMSFIRPVRIGEEVTAGVEVKTVYDTQPLIVLRTWC